MADDDNGGQAFPTPIAVGPGGDVYPGYGGMRLRDWFAGQALTGICGDDCARHNIVPGEVAQWAYQFADAMLAEREKGAR